MSSWPWLLTPAHVDLAPVRRVLVFGLGRIGSKVARALVSSGTYQVVAAIDASSALVGRRLNDVLGIDEDVGCSVAAPESFDWAAPRADAMIYAGADDLRVAEAHIMAAIENGLHVIGFTVGLVFAWRRFAEVAERIDAAARAHSVAVFGTGVNPGFVSDVLVLGLASACRDLTRIEALRVNDLSDQSPAQLDLRSIGDTEERFDERLASGRLKVHTGFDESAALLGRGLGWVLDRSERSVRPILAKTAVVLKDRTIEQGRVAGIDATSRAWSHGRLRIRSRHLHVARPEELGYRPQDRIRLRARPSINVTIKPEIEGGDATAAIAVNALSYIASAPHGLLAAGFPGQGSGSMRRTAPAGS